MVDTFKKCMVKKMSFTSWTKRYPTLEAELVICFSNQKQKATFLQSKIDLVDSLVCI